MVVVAKTLSPTDRNQHNARHNAPGKQVHFLRVHVLRVLSVHLKDAALATLPLSA